MTGQELVSAGDNYLLRLRAAQVEFAKRTAGGIESCLAPVPAATLYDGRWHHVAATTSTDQIRIYFDGLPLSCPGGTAGDIVYTAGQAFLVGRHGNGQNTWDFDGNIDEVRIFRRALAADELAALARQTQRPVPVLHWKLDETAGMVAEDSSTSDLDGTYLGMTGLPMSDASVPAALAQSSASLRFEAAGRHAVQRAAMPAALKPATNVTVSAWYRATDVDVTPGTTTKTGAELVSAGNSYLLRLRPSGVEFSKRVPGGTRQCIADAPNHLDGMWHHLVGVSSAILGLQVYFDGALICNHPADTQGILYPGPGNDFWIGRHGDGQERWDFTGSIDDVRVYAEALTQDQVTALFQNTF
jgi:hypothetical protein